MIDTPFPIVGGWVAIIWPDPNDPAGWRRIVWQPDTTTGRGWLIPERLAYADVIEFGSDPAGAQRWYGIVETYEPGQWLTLRGPFTTPTAANIEANKLLTPDQHVPDVVQHAVRTRPQRCATRRNSRR